MYAPSRKEAERQPKAFEAWCEKRGYRQAAETLGRHWDRMVTFYQFPQGALGTPPDGERGRVPICGPAAADGRGQALQALRRSHLGIWKPSDASVALLISIMPTHLLTEPP